MAKIKKAMKGGSKVVDGKKGPETAQERQLRFEIERMKEEEANRAKEDGRRNELKNRQESEEKYSRINRLKILTQWRKLMRLVKVEDLRKEIEIISQQHEREVDRKDALIQVLDRDLEDSEEQYQMALRAHLLIVDKLIDLHNSRLRGIEFEFERDLQELRDEFGSERYEMDRSHATHKKEMLDILAQMEMDFTEQENDARQEFESTREEIKNRNSEEYNVLRFTLEGLIEELERHFDSAHSNYMSTTEQRTQDFKSLTIRDQQSARTIETQMRKLQRLQDQIAHWKQKLATNGAKCEARNAAMKGERDAIAKHFQELKARMNRFRERGRRGCRSSRSTRRPPSPPSPSARSAPSISSSSPSSRASSRPSARRCSNFTNRPSRRRSVRRARRPRCASRSSRAPPPPRTAIPLTSGGISTTFSSGTTRYCWT